jgi:hypothetical protein
MRSIFLIFALVINVYALTSSKLIESCRDQCVRGMPRIAIVYFDAETKVSRDPTSCMETCDEIAAYLNRGAHPDATVKNVILFVELNGKNFML